MTNDKTGVLGGTFDPIHNGHLWLAEAVRDSLALNKVLFVPAGEPPHKRGRRIAPASHRAQMVALALKDHPHFEMSRIDLDRPGPHYSVDMLTRLRADYQLSADDCFFIIGADSLIDLPIWHSAQQLLELCRLAVAHRPGYQPDLSDLKAQLPRLPQRIVWIELPGIPISATALRAAVAQGESIDALTPPAVVRYIRQMGLYKEKQQ
jgi:nicotinate-nucleotide adenylyltransferase